MSQLLFRCFRWFYHFVHWFYPLSYVHHCLLAYCCFGEETLLWSLALLLESDATESCWLLVAADSGLVAVQALSSRHAVNKMAAVFVPIISSHLPVFYTVWVCHYWRTLCLILPQREVLIVKTSSFFLGIVLGAVASSMISRNRNMLGLSMDIGGKKAAI